MYSISAGDDDNDFAIAQNGTIYTTKLLDRETKSLYNLVVMATDQTKASQQRLSSTVQVGSKYNFWMLAESKGLKNTVLWDVTCERGEAHVVSWWGNLRERDHLESLGVEGKLMLEWILTESVWMAWTGLIGSGRGQLAGYCECGNEISDSIKCGRLFPWLKKFTSIFSVTLTLKMEPAPSFDMPIIFHQTTRCHKPLRVCNR